MKPRERKPQIVYRIINRKTGEAEGSYSRSCCDEYDFGSVAEARTANVYDVFQDRSKYAIAKYKVKYTLLDEDVDGSRGEVEELEND